MKKIILTILAVLSLFLFYLFFYPVPIEPVAYFPPKDPGLKGVFEKNNLLNKTKVLFTDPGTGPEDIALGPDSLLYTGFEDGRVVRFTMDGENVETFTNTGGRPLGMEFDHSGNLIVADGIKGLLSVDSAGAISLLADSVDGTKIVFADHLDIGSDGIIWFTDASQRNHDVETEIWELQPTGRLLSYDPVTKTAKVELEGMRFANGVALGSREEYLLVTETFGMVINKLWIKGPKKGQKEIFVNELPGFPDNITYNGRGIFWLAIPSRRIGPQFESLYDKPFLRKMVYRLPASLTGAKETPPFGMVVGLDTLGKVAYNFQDTTGTNHSITSAHEFDGALYLGSLRMHSVGKFNLLNFEF